MEVVQHSCRLGLADVLLEAPRPGPTDRGLREFGRQRFSLSTRAPCSVEQIEMPAAARLDVDDRGDAVGLTRRTRPRRYESRGCQPLVISVMNTDVCARSQVRRSSLWNESEG